MHRQRVAVDDDHFTCAKYRLRMLTDLASDPSVDPADKLSDLLLMCITLRSTDELLFALQPPKAREWAPRIQHHQHGHMVQTKRAIPDVRHHADGRSLRRPVIL